MSFCLFQEKNTTSQHNSGQGRAYESLYCSSKDLFSITHRTQKLEVRLLPSVLSRMLNPQTLQSMQRCKALNQTVVGF